MTYEIFRWFEKDAEPSRVLKTGLTLEAAQQHCADPETSSVTAKSRFALALTKREGRWFDGFREEE